jgi:NAD(P)-dependent dehydrogenase (short-subunit alcohol dehydrogenase family)
MRPTDLPAMRILVVGGTGTIGAAVAAALEQSGHQVIRVGATSGQVTVDLARIDSIDSMYRTAVEGGPVNAVVCAAGIARFGALDALTDDDFRISVENKLLGQVHLVRRGLGIVTSGGSFTLTSGDVSQKPAAGTVAATMAGAAVEAFAAAGALDLRGRYRLNVVSPAWVAESRVKAGLEPMPGIWAMDLAAYYVDLVEGDDTGLVVSADAPR